MLEEFGRAGFLLLFALAFPLAPIMASVALGAFKLRPKRPDPIKTARYYVYALIFVVFDVEILLLYPWAVALPTAGLAGFLAGALFLTILVVGFVYDWAKKALEWV